MRLSNIVARSFRRVRFSPFAVEGPEKESPVQAEDLSIVSLDELSARAVEEVFGGMTLEELARNNYGGMMLSLDLLEVLVTNALVSGELVGVAMTFNEVANEAHLANLPFIYVHTVEIVTQMVLALAALHQVESMPMFLEILQKYRSSLNGEMSKFVNGGI